MTFHDLHTIRHQIEWSTGPRPDQAFAQQELTDLRFHYGSGYEFTDAPATPEPPKDYDKMERDLRAWEAALPRHSL